MRVRFVVLVAAVVSAVLPTLGNAQTPASQLKRPAASVPPRAVRRDIPLTNMIRKAFAAGTRDSSGAPGAKYWQLSMDYTIDARFDQPTGTIEGHETATIHNNSPDTMRTVQLRLDQNLFGPNVPRAEKVTEITEGMKITRMVANGAVVNLSGGGGRGGRGGGGGAGRGGAVAAGGAAAPAPMATAGDLTQTTVSVNLATPILPHSTGTMEVEWYFRVPRADNARGIRMGSWGDSLYQVGQWYPRVAVYDDLRGWDTDPYLGPSEFYNNFGHFDVTLDMPSGWLIGAVGVLQNPNDVLTASERDKLSHILESDSVRSIATRADMDAGKLTASGSRRLKWHFVADSVADFAFTTSDRFTWDATRVIVPGLNRAIPIYEMYVGRSGATQGPVAQHAIQFYSKLWMPYRFPMLTQTDGPENGMEYPGFIMAAGSTDHEIGHQWWPMTLGTNETWYGFMDEGFNQYMNILSAADRAGRPPVLDGQGQLYGRTSGNEREAPLMWDANYGGPQYQFQAYSKAPLMLSMLGGVVGDTAVWRAMAEYAKAWRYKHPSPWDYAFFMSNALHRDLGWFWNYWLFTTESVDGSIQSVTMSGGKTTVVVKQDGAMPSPVVLKVQFAPTGAAIKKMANSRIVDSATAVVTYPVDVWFGGNRTFTADLDFGGRKIDKITRDPCGRSPARYDTDNFGPRAAAADAAPGGGRGGRGGGGGGGGRGGAQAARDPACT